MSRSATSAKRSGKAPRGLGRGLDALLGDSNSQAGEQHTLPIGALVPGAYQPRGAMDQEPLAELAESIRLRGIIQPILVRKIADNRHEIIAGERRWRAAQMAGLAEVPVLVRQVDHEGALVLALIENIQREDLNPLEVASGMERLIAEFGLTHEQVAQALGRSRPATTNLLRLLKLPTEVQQLLRQGRLDMGHARSLLTLPNAEQIAMARQLAERGVTVRQAENLVRVKKGSAPQKTDRDLARLELELSEHLGTKVRIAANSKGGGRLEISFFSPDQLRGILDHLQRRR